MNRIMRQSKSVLILAIAVMGIFISCRQSPVEIYVAPNGDDKAAGTNEQPILTFEKATEHIASLSGKKEVHVILKDGIYYLPNTLVFKPEHSGSEKFPVIVRAANEGKAIISGGDQLHLALKVRID